VKGASAPPSGSRNSKLTMPSAMGFFFTTMSVLKDSSLLAVSLISALSRFVDHLRGWFILAAFMDLILDI
jgi:hypothetical protein